MTYHSPKYWKEMKFLRKKHQASSDSQVVNQVKLSSQSQASSSKLQASSKPKPEPSSGSETSSNKHQAPSYKRQA